jgi:REP element-mobilizing transposase RayT
MIHNNTTTKEGYVIRDQTLPHFITATVVDWIDVFTRKTYRDTVIECLDYCIEHKGMVLYGYVIMSNHIHLIVQSSDGKLSDLIRDFKKFIATTVLEKIQIEPESRREWMLERFKLATESHSRNKNYQFWQYGNHPAGHSLLKFCQTTEKTYLRKVNGSRSAIKKNDHERPGIRKFTFQRMLYNFERPKKNQ